MSDEKRIMKQLRDYRPTPFIIKHCDLRFDLYKEHTQVTSIMSIAARHPEKKEALILQGVALELISVFMDGHQLTESEYIVTDESLQIKNPPANFNLQIKNKITPHNNTSLEGLYVSRDTYFTQCEAEGFRKITYFYDRPDVMVTFTTSISADKYGYPILLSNGNLMEAKDLPDGRHMTRWEDPFPKPCYLFALVAGNLACLKDKFVTGSGKNIELEIYASKNDIGKCQHAMSSLKQAMRWDEQAYGRECDLTQYKIVAASDFNMGAMENKGLNIFNTALVLAQADTTLDSAFDSVKSVIAHEYFHNWTGNRITCRDWFQLCLKEGLTVFREDEFMDDTTDAAANRIRNVQFLRQIQFPEDEGPMSHPPRPDHYIEINNFYTPTVYNKGAEVVRMLRTLMGRETFRLAMDLYFSRHDGQAVTQEDFMAAMSDASGLDLEQFMLWYTQAGLPTLIVEEDYDSEEKTLTLTLSQSTPQKPNQDIKKPFHIPIVFGMLNAKGKAIPIFKKNERKAYGHECLLELTEEKSVFYFTDVPEKPVSSLLRGFSAPVKLQHTKSFDELKLLMVHDSDSFNRWDSGQKLLGQTLGKMILDIKQNKPITVETHVLQALHAILKDESQSKLLRALSLGLPSSEALAQDMSVVDVEAIHLARTHFSEAFAQHSHDVLLKNYLDHQESGPHSTSTEAMAKRRWKNMCLHYLSYLRSDEILDLVCRQYESANNMTDVYAALQIITHWPTMTRPKLLLDFFEKWQHEDLVIDLWFSAQALSQLDTCLREVKILTKHPAFHLKNPNRFRSLISAFCKSNQRLFHSASGEGYELCREYVLELDPINPQVAASLAKSFSPWRRFDEARQQKMKNQLQIIVQTKGLSLDVYEVASKILH